MPFDPTKPAFGLPDSSAEMRAQLNGLKDLIDATPTIAAVVVDSENTLAAGSPASVNANITDNVLHLVFAIPRGDDGPPGQVSIETHNGALVNTLAAAAANSSANTNAVATMDTAFTNGPLSLADGEALRARINEILLAMRR